jgi:carbamoyl-phosphate synthase large subunit
VTCITTLAAAQAAVEACKALRECEMTVHALQDWYPGREAKAPLTQLAGKA